MSKKSKTQMTKAELIDLAYTLENKVKELEEQIETMQKAVSYTHLTLPTKA